MINLREISKAYGSKQVLNNINIEFGQGKVYGIVGENGSGKSTLFRCIAGLESHLGVIESPFQPLKNHLGFLQTIPIFLSRITGWEYLQLLVTARGIHSIDFEAKNIFNLPLDQYAETYSTGMKKKLALMGILLQENELFILDEPFNGVDIHSNMLITEIIKKLQSLNKTILISSHIFSTLADTCDEIHVLENGLFVQHAQRADFEALDAAMKQHVVGHGIDRLGLK